MGCRPRDESDHTTVGFCLVLLLVRKDITKQTLVKGVGLRFAVANWLMAGWAACFTLQFFLGAEILILLNVLNVLSIAITLIPYPPTLSRPIDALFIHAPITLLLAILFLLDWLSCGFIALGWIIEEKGKMGKWTWQAVGGVAGVNFVAAIWEMVQRSYLMAGASIYLLLTLLLSSPRTTPTLPSTALPKPTPFLVTIIICLVLHPIALIIGLAWKRSRERTGRIRLEEEVERAEEEEREAEGEHRHAHAHTHHTPRHA